MGVGVDEAMKGVEAFPFYVRRSSVEIGSRRTCYRTWGGKNVWTMEMTCTKGRKEEKEKKKKEGKKGREGKKVEKKEGKKEIKKREKEGIKKWKDERKEREKVGMNKRRND